MVPAEVSGFKWPKPSVLQCVFRLQPTRIGAYDQKITSPDSTTCALRCLRREYPMADPLDPQRRDFLKSASAVAATALTSNFFVHASDKAGTKPVVIGAGEFTYECHHNWGEVPDHIRWHATHGVAIDAAGLIYITHRAPFNSNIDTTVTFDPSGKIRPVIRKAMELRRPRHRYPSGWQ
jgi:hypothetical protein